MSNMTRRKFLHATAGATGAIVASRSILLGSAPIPSLAEALPASDRLRLGIIGVGMQGSPLLATSVSLPGVECVAACDLYDGRHTLAKEIAGDKIKIRGSITNFSTTRKLIALSPRFRIIGTSRWWWTR